jgi:gamma-glutamyltranspeptidase/glutathione hydrolase
MVRKDGLVDMAFGVMGGDYQPMGHMTVAVNRYVYGMDLQDAIDWPRYFPRAGQLVVEDGVDGAVRQALAGKGHQLVNAMEPLGGGQAVAIDRKRGVLIGASDPRKDGIALGC